MTSVKNQRDRKVPRRAISAKAGVLYKGEYFTGCIGEIGEGGVLLETEQALAVGESLVLTFRLPEENFQIVKAQIMYSQGQKSGLQFIGATFETKRQIRNFVASGHCSENRRYKKAT